MRIALMRNTVHLVSARDCLGLRPLTQPVIDRGLYGRRTDIEGVDLEALAAASRALLEEGPRTAKELGGLLAERWPGREPASLARAARHLLPLVQVPPRGVWGKSGQATHTTAEAWLGRPLGPAYSPDEMVLRYLGAFGPASIKDAQTWSGLTRLDRVFGRLGPRLVSFRDERGREVFDLPDAPRPDPEVPAPPRFLPEFDNLILSHDDRSRVIADEHRRAARLQERYGPGHRASGWFRPRHVENRAIPRQGDDRDRTVRSRCREEDRDALTEEGERLARFVAGRRGDEASEVRFEAKSRGRGRYSGPPGLALRRPPGYFACVLPREQETL